MRGPTRSLEVVAEPATARGALSPRVGLRWPLALAAAALSLLAALAVSQGFGAGHGATVAHRSHASVASHKELSSLPLPTQAPISAALGRDDRAYHVSGSGTSLRAANPSQRLDVHFGQGQVAVSSGAARVGLALSALGAGTSLSPVGDAAPKASVNRVEYAYPNVREWYTNGPVGLEQGFTVAHAPAGAHGAGLTLALALSGNMRASLARGGRSVTLSHAGSPSLTYAGLSATDASGRALHSSLSVRGGELLLSVDPRGARYPIHIDPFIQQGEKLVGTGTVGTAFQGFSVALSTEGTTAIVGGPEDKGDLGAAWVFTRSGTTWTQQAKLVTTGAAGRAEVGSSVALDANGSIAIVGGPDDNSDAGAAWIFTRSGTTWTQQGSKLVGNGAEGEAEQGFSVAISSEGNTALVGGSSDAGGIGATWVFTRSESTWTQQGEKLVGTGVEGVPQQGSSVALSAEGTTALVGGPGDTEGAGATWVFTRTGTTWSQQGGKLVGTGAEGEARQGTSVALSSKGGNFAIIGGPENATGAGASWIFTRTGTTWAQQTKLLGTGATGAAHQGRSVAINAEGTTVLIGGPNDKENLGAMWVFTRSGTTWTQQGSKLSGTGNTGNPMEGLSVSIGGETALMGGPEDNADAGAAWVFTRSGTKWTQQGSKLSGTGALGDAFQGFSVAVSSEGSTAIVGGPTDAGAAGAAWVFTRTGTTWSQQAKLVGTGASGLATQGFSVALSSNGNTALVGGPLDKEAAGAVWVFTRSGTTWTQQGSKLVGTGAEGTAEQGFSVALSAEGTTALIGGFEDNADAGAAWVFTRSGEKWTQQGSKLVGTGAEGAAEQGWDVALSAEGNTALIGGPADTEFDGATWVFTRSGTTWTQQGEKLVGTGAVGIAQQGTSVAISGEGTTALIGGPSDNEFTGAAWVFTRSGTTWTQQGEKLVGAGATGTSEEGHDVALSSNGNIALIGGPNDNSNAGAAWVFNRTGTTWAQAGEKLIGSGAVGAAAQGFSVALSGNGTTALLAGPEDNDDAGAIWPFLFTVTAPAVVTEPATEITTTSATLNGSVNPDGSEVTSCSFEYGTTLSYGKSMPCGALPGKGNSAVAVSAKVTGLTPNNGYHFRLVASNGSGPGTGADETFKTLTSCNAEGFCQAITNYETPHAAFTGPNALALDPSSNLWVADSAADQLIKLNPEHTKALAQLGSEGTGSGQFKGISAIATNSAGDLYAADSGNARIQEFGPAGEFIRSFGSSALKGGQLLAPSAIAIDASNNVWVLNAAGATGDRIVEFSSEGAELSKFGTNGSGEGQLGTAYGLAISGGNLYVAEAANSRVQEFSTAGAFIARFDEAGSGNGKSNTPNAIATEASTGNLYVSETGTDRVQVFSPAGAFVTTFASPGSGAGQLANPGGLAIATSGTVFLSDTANRRLQEWSKGSPPTYSQSFTHYETPHAAFTGPNAVALDSSSNLWVADSAADQLIKLNPEHTKALVQLGSEGSGSGQFKGISAIATNSAGDLYAADSGNNRIQEFGPGGEFIRSFGSSALKGGQLLSPSAIAIDASNNVWVLNAAGASGDRIVEFSSEGAELSKFGTNGSGEGQLSTAYGLAISGGNLYVAEAANSRVQEFSTAGAFIAKFDEAGPGTGKSNKPNAIATEASTGNLFVSETGNNRVQVFSPAGAFITTFASPGSGAGQLSNPGGLAIATSGTVFLSDTGNRRLQEWAPVP